MQYRNIVKNNDGTYNIVWFNSYGIDIDNPDNIPAQYATLPIINLPATVPDEFPYAVCGFTDVTTTGSPPIASTEGSTNYAIENGTAFHLSVNGTPGKNIKIQIYKTSDSNKVYFPDTTFTLPVEFDGTLNFPSSDLGARQFCTILVTEGDSGMFTEITKFFLKIDGYQKRLDAGVNYVERQEGVAKSLVQRLAVIKGELWYNINYGLPLFDKVRNKAIMDAAIIQIITNHPEVANIINFTSEVKQSRNSTYYFKADILSIFGETFSVSSDYPF